MTRIVGIRFKKAGRIYDFDAGVLELAFGDDVIIEVEKGIGLGTVAKTPKDADASTDDSASASGGRKLKRVVRKADTVDLERKVFNKEREEEAFKVCADKIKEYKLPMKLVNVEYLFDSSKAIFYFTSESRVDFRVLVKDMAAHLFTRIEMRQIGVRDEAKLLGGFGPCGRELCCAGFLDDFKPVTVRMAKEQGLALNPLKISGVCGRLMCCLSYEYEGGSSKKRGKRTDGKKPGGKGRDDRRGGQKSGDRCCATSSQEAGGGTCVCPSKREGAPKSGAEGEKVQLRGDIHIEGASFPDRRGEEPGGEDKKERDGKPRDSRGRDRKGRDERGRDRRGRTDRVKVKDPRKAPLKGDVHLEGVIPEVVSEGGAKDGGQRADGQKNGPSQRSGKRRGRRRGRRGGFRKKKVEGQGGSGSSFGGSSGSGDTSGGSSTPSSGGSNDS